MIVYGINETIYGEHLLQRMAHHMHFKMDLAVVVFNNQHGDCHGDKEESWGDVLKVQLTGSH